MYFYTSTHGFFPAVAGADADTGSPMTACAVIYTIQVLTEMDTVGRKLEIIK